MKYKNILTGVLSVLFIIFGNSAGADFLMGPSYINSSTSLVAVQPWTIDQIADGNTSDNPPYNGFVSSSTAGTITLALVGSYDLRGFKLWNDVNILGEGIQDFRLDFFDASGATTPFTSSATLTAQNPSLLDGELFPFASAIPGVNKVNLVVLSCKQGGVIEEIEIREVAFEGQMTAVPIPAALWLFGSALAGLVGVARRKHASVA